MNCFSIHFSTTFERKHRLLTDLQFLGINSNPAFLSNGHMTDVFQDCEKAPVASDMLTILVMTPITSGSICLRRVVGISSSLQDFEDMLCIMLDTSASVMDSNCWKPD